MTHETDNRSLTETDIRFGDQHKYNEQDITVDPLALFTNACANHSETLCKLIADALAPLSLDSNTPEGDVLALLTIQNALEEE